MFVSSISLVNNASFGFYLEKVTIKMVVKKRTKKRVKKSGLIYFATNTRLADIVKIGMTVNTAEERLNTANRKHEFMAGRWSISQKVKTNDVKRTEELAHQLFKGVVRQSLNRIKVP